jgi:hypothetical protein
MLRQYDLPFAGLNLTFAVKKPLAPRECSGFSVLE